VGGRETVQSVPEAASRTIMDSSGQEKSTKGCDRHRGVYFAGHILKAVKGDTEEEGGEEKDVIFRPVLRAGGVDERGSEDEDEGEEIDDMGVRERNAEVFDL